MDWAISKHFHSGREGLIYEKLYKKNMDGKKSFVSTKIGLERLLESDSQALISNLPIQNFEDFHCKVSIINNDSEGEEGSIPQRQFKLIKWVDKGILRGPTVRNELILIMDGPYGINIILQPNLT